VKGLAPIALLAALLAPAPAQAAPADTLAALEGAVAKDSSNVANLYRLGVAYLDRDRIAEATRVLTRANVLKPGDVKILVNLGAAYDAAGQGGAAQRHYQEALKIAPGDSVAACRLASSYYSTGFQTLAMDQLRDIIRRHPRAHCAYFTLGVAFADAGIYRDAIRTWRKVVELAPDSPEGASARESIEVLEKYLTDRSR